MLPWRRRKPTTGGNYFHKLATARARPFASIGLHVTWKGIILITISAIISIIYTVKLAKDRQSLIHFTSVDLSALLLVSKKVIIHEAWAATPSGTAGSLDHASRDRVCNALQQHGLPRPYHSDLAHVQQALAQYITSHSSSSSSSSSHTADHDTTTSTSESQWDSPVLRAAYALVFSPHGMLQTDGQLGSQLDALGAPRPLTSALLRALSMLKGSGRVLRCSPDLDLIQAANQTTGRRILMSVNLYNSGEVLPNMIVQLMRLASSLPPGTLLISIYESGSKDATHTYLQLLRVLLCPLPVPFHIQTGGALTRGRDEETERRVDRIEFLAKVRNAALEPVLKLAQSTAHLGHGSGGANHDVVVFINDVFFCMEGLLRLVQHGQDMSCGLDLHTDGIFKPQDWRPLWFYDSWVSRDITGAIITGSFPIMADATSTQRARAGLPFPAYCCWNGMVALSAHPFIAHGLRFRSSLPGECRASECSLLCDDFHRLGFRRVAIDPNVHSTYHIHHAQAVLHHQRSFDPQLLIRPTTWREVQAAGPIPQRAPDYESVVCCSKKVDSDSIPWKQCHPTSIMANNFTADFLAGLALQAAPADKQAVVAGRAVAAGAAAQAVAARDA